MIPYSLRAKSNDLNSFLSQLRGYHFTGDYSLSYRALFSSDERYPSLPAIDALIGKIRNRDEDLSC